MANPTFPTMEERLERLERKLDNVAGTMAGMPTRDEFKDLAERMYGVEERIDALNTRLDVGVESLRGDFKLAFERIDGLREFMERSREDDRRERGAERELLFTLVRDHNRRLRAIERLEQRRAAKL